MVGYFNLVKGYGFIIKFLDVFIFSFAVPLCAYCAFVLFMRLNIENNKYINKLGSTTLGIYLLHDSCIGRELIWHDLLKVDSVLYNSIYFPLWALLCIMLVFLIGALIDIVRQEFIDNWLINRLKQRIPKT